MGWCCFKRRYHLAFKQAVDRTSYTLQWLTIGRFVIDIATPEKQAQSFISRFFRVLDFDPEELLVGQKCTSKTFVFN